MVYALYIPRSLPDNTFLISCIKKQRVVHWIIWNAPSATSLPKHLACIQCENENQTVDFWIMSTKMTQLLFFALWIMFDNQAHFRRAIIRAWLCCKSERDSTLFYHSWNPKNSSTAEMAKHELSNIRANLNLEKNSKREQGDEESVVSLLFYYLVSLWRNPQIASTDPGFTVACHPGNL